ncbi:DUF2075 domain-containing protein [Acholeplasma equirhinis]|uniref:DUF2075 domain-containing protein n=1 Tax=Acholeplasma equirhinis TaxID=555393 RepID=UPI00197AD149|nr:DUF2075 domain-containing protein [Acholeplasma equirhinis]MBN3490614.1 DUF2075 domain-containing protein [Acholeplasma equirhinis]
MIVYSNTKREFIKDVINNQIADKIQHKFLENSTYVNFNNEFSAWTNSMQFMRNLLDHDSFSDDALVAIEYQIPRTSKRVDFIICGSNNSKKDNIVVIELKQWTKLEKVDDESKHTVKTYTGNANRYVSHPSYQAYSYSTSIKNASMVIQEEDITIIPTAYLHNYERTYYEDLTDDIYQTWIKEAPVFIKDEMLKLREFLSKFVCNKPSDQKLLYKIESGAIRPSKALQDAIKSVLQGKKEFLLLDDQVVAFDSVLSNMAKCLQDGKKRTVIIQGGPGTGKSVLAINLLKELIDRGLFASYVTKNSAPREAFLKLLGKDDLKLGVSIKSIFRSPFNLSKAPENAYKCLIVDEAHRLVKKMYGDFTGQNQVRECINASLLTVFLIDEDQRITTKDIGSVDEIKKHAHELNSQVIMSENLILKSQFRCNGSDAYIQLVNNLLQAEEYIDIDIKDLDYEVKVFDDPSEMKNALKLINETPKHFNKVRMVAGYCYDWNVKFNRGMWDIIIGDFKAQWNLDNDKTWAISQNSFDQVGCIHTAQGLEFDYVGVIIGKDLVFRDGIVLTDRTKISNDDKSSGIKSTDENTARKLILNTYKTLLTRGQKGCYIYCEDENLREHFKNIIKQAQEV